MQEASYGLHGVLERAPVLVLAATELSERQCGEREDEHLVGAAFCPRTLDEARRALWEW